MKPTWIKTTTLTQKLNISRATLYRWIAKGKVKKGKHYRDIGLGNDRKTYQWNFTRIQELIGND